MNGLIHSLGNVCAVIGAQWGDEGKGKAIDLLSADFDVIARACGGANAGHTIVVSGKKHIFRLLPSGSLHENTTIVLGGGMVIHLPTLLEEIDILKKAGIDLVPRLSIASNAHVLFEYHKDIDGVLEERRVKAKGKGIGTTKRGIGPAYMDKASRAGLRMEILSWPTQRVREELQQRSEAVKHMYGVMIDIDRECQNVEQAKVLLEHRLDNALPHSFSVLRNQGKKLLIEGAQATLLDIDHGTYPYVTSSATTAAGALQGLGLAPKLLDSCIGVAKAYCTRVGEGDFFTEAEEVAGNRLRERGGEYGSVTGRPRRCGWLFLPDLAYAAMLNGFDCWNITKLDVLDEEDRIPVGIGKEGENVIYEYLPGWKTSTQGITDFKKLPKQAQTYIAFIEERTGLPARMIGTGQGREEMIVR